MSPEQRADKLLRMIIEGETSHLSKRILAVEIRAALEERDREWCVAVVAGSPDPSVVQSITAEFCQARALKAKP